MACFGLARPHPQVVAARLDGVYFPVAFECDPLVFEPLCQLLNQVHRTVLAASASDSHGDIAAVVAGECVKPIF